MLATCFLYADSHSLIFNASKSQLIRFSCCPVSTNESAEFSFCCQKLSYCKSVTHLGHILSDNLSDNLDIIAIKKVMCKKENHMLSFLRPCDLVTKTKLMHSFCRSLYGASLWKASSLELWSLEIAYTNILRKIWRLPRHCHTFILHCIGGGSSVFYTSKKKIEKEVGMTCQKTNKQG